MLPLAAVALALALAGGYLMHCPWTGITPQDQLWDLLHVIVLPVALITLPIWYRTRARWYVEWRLVLFTISVAFAVLIIGGYGFNWTWTGFQGNTLWDWLELLALPVVVATLPLWFATHRDRRARWRAAAIAGAVAGIVLLIGGYGFNWTWTGFQGNTLWDWLRLLLVPFVLPAALAWVAARAEWRAAAAPAAPDTVTRAQPRRVDSGAGRT